MAEPLQGSTKSEYIVPGHMTKKETLGKLSLLSLRKERDLLTVLMIYNYVVGNVWRRLNQAYFFEGDGMMGGGQIETRKF